MTVLRYIQAFASIAIWDLINNRRYAKSDKLFLVVRHPGKLPFFYESYLNWLAVHFPQLRAHFELHLLPTTIRHKGKYVLHIPWLQDPVEAWSKIAYRQSMHLMESCDKLGIPVVNMIDHLPNATKSVAPGLIASAVPYFRTPRTVLIRDIGEFYKTQLGLSFPIMIREDQGHQNPIIRINNIDELQAVSIAHLKGPVASQIIDVRSPDGLYRKYRYVVAGNIGVPLSMHLCENWIAHGMCALYNDQMHTEEKKYTLTPCPYHSQFVKAREALDLDLVAFDYSIDNTGTPVVWEANPYPYFHFPSGEMRRDYGGMATARVFAAMTMLYLQRAGLKVSRDLEAAAALAD